MERIAPIPTPRYNSGRFKEYLMAEKTSHTRKPFEGKIPEETRQHFRTAHEEFHKSLEGIFPPGFREHHRKARKEMLLAWRSLIDASLYQMETENCSRTHPADCGAGLLWMKVPWTPTVKQEQPEKRSPHGHQARRLGFFAGKRRLMSLSAAWALASLVA
jgi:hypothetical protein